MLALAYVRRSKQSKKNPSASPERQAAAIGDYCDGKGWTVDWYRDAEGHRRASLKSGVRSGSDSRRDWKQRARVRSPRSSSMRSID